MVVAFPLLQCETLSVLLSGIARPRNEARALILINELKIGDRVQINQVIGRVVLAKEEGRSVLVALSEGGGLELSTGVYVTFAALLIDYQLRTARELLTGDLVDVSCLLKQ